MKHNIVADNVLKFGHSNPRGTDVDLMSNQVVLGSEEQHEMMSLTVALSHVYAACFVFRLWNELVISLYRVAKKTDTLFARLNFIKY